MLMQNNKSLNIKSLLFSDNYSKIEKLAHFHWAISIYFDPLPSLSSFKKARGFTSLMHFFNGFNEYYCFRGCRNVNSRIFEGMQDWLMLLWFLKKSWGNFLVDATLTKDLFFYLELLAARLVNSFCRPSNI
jgi:hypothetical protein